MITRRLLVATANILLKLLGGTLRWKITDLAGYRDPARQKPVIAGIWHNRILVLPLVYQWMCGRPRRLTILTSASRDGALLADFTASFGMHAVRGSSSRGGAQALLRLRSLLEAGSDIAITPDGPRGPVYEPGPGLLHLAERTGYPVMGVQVTYHAFWELRSWDKFRIPKPFSTVEVTFLPGITLSSENRSALLEILGA